jgi:hypothetical protein
MLNNLLADLEEYNYYDYETIYEEDREKLNCFKKFFCCWFCRRKRIKFDRD